MYRIRVVHDMFNISNRIKRIDRGYYIMYNAKTNKYEVHNSNQIGSTYCLTSPYPRLDARLLDYVVATSLTHNRDLIRIIEQNNERLEKERRLRQQDYIESNLKSIYNIVSNSTKEYDLKNSFETKWV